MDNNTILSKVDHTLLLQTSTEEEIKAIIDEGIMYKTASVCIPPCYVEMAKKYSNGNVPICTVIGFPNGYSTTAVKVFETEDAIKNGADEIDMVLNIGWFKAKQYAMILEEIKKIKKACGNKILKVIIEICLLTDEEIIKMSEIVSKAGAEYIKTSTGFSKSGATFAAVDLMKKNVEGHVKVKASGGISSIDDAIKFIQLGADRLGTSRIVKIVKESIKK